MNVLDAYVTEILSEPYEAHGKWWVRAKYVCWGSAGETNIMFQQKEAALALKVGDHFHA